MLKKILIAAAAATLLTITVAAGLYGYYFHVPKNDPPKLPGTYSRHTLNHDGYERHFSIYRPSALAQDAALVMVLHGSRGSGEAIRQQTAYEFDQLAEKQGFIVAYPDGYENHWNDCRKSASYSANRLGIDDVGFLTTLAGKLASETSLSPQRVFVTGFSNGGHMAFRLGLEAPDKVAAIAAIAANLPADDNLDCAKSGKPVPVAVFNGSADPINPYDGGLVKIGNDVSRGTVQSTGDTIAYWRDLASIEQQPGNIIHPERDNTPDTAVEEQRWKNNAGIEIRLYTLMGSGHVIPSRVARFPRILGEPAGDISAPAEILDFFLSSED